MKVEIEADPLANLILEYEKRFKHLVPGWALRDYPNLALSLEKALESGEPISEFRDHQYNPGRTDEIPPLRQGKPENACQADDMPAFKKASRLFRKPIGYLGIVLLVALALAGWAAYFINYADSASGVMVDGLGRELHEAPAFARIILGQDRLWAGFTWFLIDLGALFGIGATGYQMVRWGLDKEL